MTTEARTSAPEDSDEIDLRQLLGTLIDYKWWIVGITGLFFVVAVAYALLATPIYRADAIVQVESKVPSLPGLSDISQSLGMGTGSAEATTEIALITSRAVACRALEALTLARRLEPNRARLLLGYGA
ncbi:MAG: Wzz/FepE/Etk N-terminal domain-containing protein, partial [Stenotrophomonas maltophilia]|nr:Wzz/FepE/Etk N-terminal domain-containing protein [Stenotrophomonas maltophilia]